MGCTLLAPHTVKMPNFSSIGIKGRRQNNELLYQVCDFSLGLVVLGFLPNGMRQLYVVGALHLDRSELSHIRVAAAAAAKLLQSCLTLRDPIDGSPPGSPVPGILQARTLEWVAISFSNA